MCWSRVREFFPAPPVISRIRRWVNTLQTLIMLFLGRFSFQIYIQFFFFFPFRELLNSKNRSVAGKIEVMVCSIG